MMTALAAVDLRQEEEDALEMNEQYLIFAICEDAYGISISDVVDIIPVAPITPLPRQPHYVKGIVNNRGTILPVMDVRLRFNREPAEYHDRTCIIVVNLKISNTANMSVGLIVDTVLEVVTIPQEQVVLPPPSMSNHFVVGIGKTGDNVRLLVECSRLLDEIRPQDDDGII